MKGDYMYFLIDKETNIVSMEKELIKKNNCIISSDIKTHLGMQEFMCKYPEYFYICFEIVYVPCENGFFCYLTIDCKKNNEYASSIWMKKTPKLNIKITEKDNIFYNTFSFFEKNEKPHLYIIPHDDFNYVCDLFYKIKNSKRPKPIIKKIIGI